LPVGHKDRTDQDQHVVHASGFSVDVTLSRKQLLELTDDGQLFATHVFHSFATSTQLQVSVSETARVHRTHRRRGDYMARRGACAAAAMPVIGFLDSRMTSPLKEVGLVEGENVTIIYRWAEDRVDRLPGMASELAQQATVIVTSGGLLQHSRPKAATTTIPVVFLVGEDPARLGLVTSLGRPGGNLTGINMSANELEAKRLQLLHQLVTRPFRPVPWQGPDGLQEPCLIFFAPAAL
jgi:ABC transporter substrate binding protein